MPKLLFRSKPPARRVTFAKKIFIMIQFTLPIDRHADFLHEAAESIVINDASIVKKMLLSLADKWWYGATINSLVKQIRQLFGLDFAMSVERWLRALAAKYTADPPRQAETAVSARQSQAAPKEKVAKEDVAEQNVAKASAPARKRHSLAAEGRHPSVIGSPRQHQSTLARRLSPSSSSVRGQAMFRRMKSAPPSP